MTGKEFRKVFEAYIAKEYGTGTAAANHWGVSKAYVSMVLNGVKPPNQAMLEEMGFVREVKRVTTEVYKRA